jgi:GNAT superfamily N-acetyltransferase
MAMRRLGLAGFSTRAASPGGRLQVAPRLVIGPRRDTGEPGLSLEDIEAGWQRPDVHLGDDSIMVLFGKDLAAYAEVYHWRGEATVHPSYRGLGIGAWLVEWTEYATLKRRWPNEETRIGQTIVDSNTAAIDLLVGHGYTPRHTSWELVVPRDGVIESRPLPEGYRIRPFDPGTESHQVYQVIEDAFNEWPGRTPGTFNKWKAIVLDRSDFDPRLLLVALNGDQVVGASVGILYGDQGWIDQIAVHRDHRNRGLARNLIIATFDQLKALGAADTRLSTDSRTGALDLYTSIGMVVHRSYTHYSKLLTG